MSPEDRVREAVKDYGPMTDGEPEPDVPSFAFHIVLENAQPTMPA